jgi:NitT/TauT family transport system ATP-binding protein
MIAGLEEPSAGSVEIDGAPPLATLRRAGLSVAFQDPSLLPWRSVRGNIELALNLARRGDPSEIDQLITLVGLDGFRRDAPCGAFGRHAPARGHRAGACHAAGSPAAR